MAVHENRSAAAFSPRTDYERRGEYVATTQRDEFIVPLLREWISSSIKQYMSPRGRTLRVLDVGCGQQPFRQLIEVEGGHYTGMDVHQNAAGNVAFLGVIDASLPDGLLARGPFDLVLCTEVLEHVANWLAAFENMAQLLAPEGVLILTCPQVYPLHEEPYDFWRATSYTIELYGKRFGLVPERVERLGNAWDVLGGVLGTMTPVPYRRTLWNRCMAKCTRMLLKSVIFRLLRQRWFHKHFDPLSTFYLSNAAVLRKPANS